MEDFVVKVLVIGSGGREHAIIRSLKPPHQTTEHEVFCFPGSDAIFEYATCLPPSVIKNKQIIPSKLKNLGIKMVIVGPEIPLVEGIADDLRKEGMAVFGPSKRAANLEGSKIYAKEFMNKVHIPTSPYHIVHNHNDTLAKAKKYFNPPYVLKVDGLAAGKGVYISHSIYELEKASHEVFEEKRFGNTLALLEEFQQGQEISYLILTNGHEFAPLPLIQDYKPLLEGNKGPNTGGMGAIGPIPISQDLKQKIEIQIVKPTLDALKQNGLDYYGVLYIGLIVTKEGPKVLEYNIRFGDPETQVILPLLKGQWVDVFYSIAQGDLPQLLWKKQFTSVVVVATKGYPQSSEKGIPILGDLSKNSDNCYFLHAGTKKDNNNQWITNGGRVLNAVGIADTQGQALKESYHLLENIYFEGMQYRKDIGQNELAG